MKNLTGAALAAGLILSGCAGGAFEQPPAAFSQIHNAAKARITYQNYAAKDYRYITPGTTGTGNCATFAFTVEVDALKAGLNPEPVKLCRLPNGVGHAYTRVGNWDSDVRFGRLIPATQQDCK